MGDVHGEMSGVEARRRPGIDPSPGRDAPGVAAAPASGLAPAALLWLQGKAGNAAVSRLVGSLGSRPVVRDVSPQSAVVQRLVDKPQEHPTLRWGSNRPEVGELQERLNEEGVADPALEVDEIFGGKTAAAVQEFQGRHGLQVDGVVGIRTWGVLDALKRAGIAGPTKTVLEEANPVDLTQQAAVAAILNPPADQLPMTGTGPAGKFESDEIEALDNAHDVVVHQWTLPTPSTDMDHASRIGAVAQQEVERCFAGEITMASRKPTGAWHPGSSSMNLADATVQNATDGEVVRTANTMMDATGSPASHVVREHHYNEQRPLDLREHDRVRDVWLNQHEGRRKAREVDQAWPLSTSGKQTDVQLRNFRFEGRAGMWRLFVGLAHECLHLINHPNYEEAAGLIGGNAWEVLIEGMNEHMSMELWRAVRARIAGDPALRATVEGPYAPPVPGPDDYAEGGDIDKRVTDPRYPSMADADAIVANVGESNARAAYFMGHLEALGISPPTPKDPTGLEGFNADAGRPDEYVVPDGGRKVGEIKYRTGSDEIYNRMDEPYEDPDELIDAGETVIVPGLRWHTTIPEDTRGQVANQHGIAQASLERANKIGHQDPGTPLPPGKTLMVPVS